jgi:hypothetical protein
MMMMLLLLLLLLMFLVLVVDGHTVELVSEHQITSKDPMV